MTGNEQPFLAVGGLLVDLRKHIVTMNESLSISRRPSSRFWRVLRSRPGLFSNAKNWSPCPGYDCPEQEARTIIKTHISHCDKSWSETERTQHILNVRGVGTC